MCVFAASGLAAEVEAEEQEEQGWGDDAELILDDGEHLKHCKFTLYVLLPN